MATIIGRRYSHTAPPETVTTEGGGESPRRCPACGHTAIQKPYKKVFLDRLFDRIFRQGAMPASCQALVHGYGGFGEPCYCEHHAHGS